jgi:glycogen(starch) synthase
MRVLMFGWEFPPHISGGLGTACHGLTESLGKEQVDVLFVVPKLFGGESVDRVDFVDAGTVPLSKKKSFRMAGTSVNIRWSEAVSGQTEKTVLEVESTLSPYHSSEEYIYSTSIENWSYEIERSSTVKTEDKTIVSEEQYTHKFSGTYGPGLLREVSRYAEVAAQIGRSYDFDVIHAHDWMTFPAALAAHKASGKPMILHVHSTEFDRSGDHIDKNLFEIERRGLEHAQCIFTVSAWTRDIVINRYGIPKNRVRVMYNGIVPREHPLGSGMPWIGSHVVTFLGRITYQKGPFYFIEAAKKVLEKFPDAHFVMAGSGDLFPKAIERVAELRLSSRFHFTGFVRGEKTERVWSISNVYVMPSVSEPFGITPLEAIQAGVPVIVSNQSGVAEVMPHAMKVDFWNTDRLADAICNVLQYKSLTTTLKKHGMAEIKNMSWQKTAKKIKRIYHELAQ